MKRIAIFLILPLLCLTAKSFGAETFSPFHHDIYALGMGDAFVAAGSDANAFLYNPALLSRVENTQISILDFQASVNTEFSDVVDYMDKNKDQFEEWDSLTPAERNNLLRGIQKFDDRWVSVGGFPSVNVVLPMGAGLAVYDNLVMKVRLDRGIYEPRGYAQVLNDLVFAAGYAHDVTPNLAVGGNIKFISRRYSGDIKLRASQFGNAQDIYDEVRDTIETTRSGFGLDVGGLYAVSPNLDIGASITDLIGTVDGKKTPINFRAGTAYHYTNGFVENSKFLREIVFAGDIDDLFNRDGDQLFNKIHLGADFVMPVFDFRFGFNQGYPGFGVGLNFKYIMLDYAYVGQELGNGPGRNSDYSHYFQLKLGIM